jgi:hypothetical protein
MLVCLYGGDDVVVAERESWVSALRALVPKAKVELAKEMLMRKAKRKANLELAQQQILEAIESIMRDSKRVAVRGGFKMYADVLADCFRELLKGVDQVVDTGPGCAKKCSYAISSIVDNANSTAAVCTNNAIQDEIVIRTHDIAIETANMLGYAAAETDPGAKAKKAETAASIHQQVAEILALLAAAGNLEQELDDAKHGIEQTLAGGAAAAGNMRSGTAQDANVDALTDKAKMISNQIRNIAQNATLQPERVGEYSKAAGQLMCELLEATTVLAVANGVDPSDPEYLAGASDISEHKRQQLESMLAAAKGFAAATTNIIDLLRQIPHQEDDENLKFRLSVATRSADNALNAFMGVTQTIDTDNLKQGADATAAAYATAPSYDDEPFDYGAYADAYVPAGANAATANELDAEMELLAALEAIESSVAKLNLDSQTARSRHSAMPAAAAPQRNAQNDYGAAVYKTPALENIEARGNISAPVMAAALKMGEVTAQLVAAAAAAQKEIKESAEYSDVYRKDPNWARGLGAAAAAVADTTNQLTEIALDPNSTPEDMVAAVRCVNGATARLVAYCRAKGDNNSEAQKAVDRAAKAIAGATNQLVTAAKSQAIANQESTAEQLKSICTAPRTRQIKHEFEAQARVAKLENDLDAARQYLFKLRRAVYGNTPPASSSTSSSSSSATAGAVASSSSIGGARSAPATAPRSQAPAVAPRAVVGTPPGVVPRPRPQAPAAGVAASPSRPPRVPSSASPANGPVTMTGAAPRGAPRGAGGPGLRGRGAPRGPRGGMPPQ